MKSNEEFKAAVMDKKERYYARRRSAVKKNAAAACSAVCCALLLFGGIYLGNSGLFKTMSTLGEEDVKENTADFTSGNTALPEGADEGADSETPSDNSAKIFLLINRDGEEDRISLTWDQAGRIADEFEKTSQNIWDGKKEEISAAEKVYGLEFGGKSYVFSNLGTLVIDGATFFLSAEQTDALSLMLGVYG